MKLLQKLQRSHSFKKNLRAVLAPSLLLALIVLLLVVFFNFFFQLRKPVDLQPVESIEVSEPFSGQVYFNNELGTNVFSDVIIPAIDQSQQAIELAVYSMDDTRIRDAIYRAAKRGVKVDLIFSDKRKEGHDQVFKDLPDGIRRQDVSSSQGSMHHKFLLIDRGTPQAKLFFGSYNFTYLQEKYDPCFLLQTSRPEIISVFGKEFDRLKSGYHGLGKLGANPNPFAARIKYPEGFLEIWFSPQSSQGGLKERMMELMKGSTGNIKVLIWNFTSNDLAAELAVLAQREPVRIITDDINYALPDSAFSSLLTEKVKHRLDKLEIITDAKRNQEIKNNFKEADLNSFLHHHLLLVDDRIAVFGTNNWSNNGFYDNDESIMVSDIGSLVEPFKGVWEFNYLRNK